MTLRLQTKKLWIHGPHCHLDKYRILLRNPYLKLHLAYGGRKPLINAQLKELLQSVEVKEEFRYSTPMRQYCKAVILV
jgi:hypothetical protein